MLKTVGMASSSGTKEVKLAVCGGCTPSRAPSCPRAASTQDASQLTGFRRGSAEAPEEAGFGAAGPRQPLFLGSRFRSHSSFISRQSHVENEDIPTLLQLLARGFWQNATAPGPR